MVLRMVFGPEDVQRVVLADGADPMWELVLSLHQAQAPAVAPRFVHWRRALAGRAAELRGEAMTMLRALVPPLGDFPDFLTPYPPTGDFTAGCEALAATAPERVAGEIAALHPAGSVPAGLRRLAAGRHGVGEVVRSMRAGHRQLVEPCWPEIRRAVAEDRYARLEQLTTQGVGAVLAGLPGALGWDGRVLRVDYPDQRTVELAGRGLTLLPAYFCWGHPLTWLDPGLPPVLVYQAGGSAAPDWASIGPPDELSALLGHPRAHCLSVLVRPCSTTELAQRLGISVGSAGRHVAILGHAGLVRSERTGGAILHSDTDLGLALLAGGSQGTRG